MTRTTVAVACALLLPVAASAQSDDFAIALDSGGAPQTVARLANGQWVRVADTLACAAREADAERIVLTDGAADPPARIVPGSDEWNLLAPTIARVFEQRQREHEIVAAHLAGVPLEIEWVFGSPARRGLPAISYFEASRRVPDPGTAPDEDPKGTLRVSVSGWLHRAGEAVTVLGSKSELGWQQDRPEEAPLRRPDLVPLGVAGHEGRWIWVMKGSAGDIAWVTAYVAGDSEVRTLVDGVRCAR